MKQGKAPDLSALKQFDSSRSEVFPVKKALLFLLAKFYLYIQFKKYFPGPMQKTSCATQLGHPGLPLASISLRAISIYD